MAGPRQARASASLLCQCQVNFATSKMLAPGHPSAWSSAPGRGNTEKALLRIHRATGYAALAERKFDLFSFNVQHEPVAAQIFETHNDFTFGRFHRERFAEENRIGFHPAINHH